MRIFVSFIGILYQETKGRVKRLLWRQRLCALFSTILVAAFLLSFVELTLGTLTVLKTYLSADYNSSTTGEIIKSDMWYISGGRYGWGGRYAYNIRYLYEVKNITYEGKFIRLDNHSEPDKADAQRTISRYPLGKTVTVYYDIRSPKYSVLENKGLSFEILARLLFIIIVSPIVGWLLCKWFRISPPKY